MDQNIDTSEKSLFLKVRSRDTVLVGENEICKVLSFIGGSRDPDAPSLFQVANVDTGEIKTIHAAEVKEIVSTYEQEVMKRMDSSTSTEQQ
jgi:hypothetical protein